MTRLRVGKSIEVEPLVTVMHLHHGALSYW
jgi:hypothetical protein